MTDPGMHLTRDMATNMSLHQRLTQLVSERDALTAQAEAAQEKLDDLKDTLRRTQKRIADIEEDVFDAIREHVD